VHRLPSSSSAHHTLCERPPIRPRYHRVLLPRATQFLLLCRCLLCCCHHILPLHHLPSPSSALNITHCVKDRQYDLPITIAYSCRAAQFLLRIVIPLVIHGSIERPLQCCQGPHWHTSALLTSLHGSEGQQDSSTAPKREEAPC
jgi:hypothetical protein